MNEKYIDKVVSHLLPKTKMDIDGFLILLPNYSGEIYNSKVDDIRYGDKYWRKYITEVYYLSFEETIEVHRKWRNELWKSMNVCHYE